MTKIVYTTTQGASLLGAAPVNPELLRRSLAVAPSLVAADGGANTAMDLGHRPDLVIGDLDSLTRRETWQKSGIQIVEIVEQMTTDFEKCLYSVDAPFFVGCGFLGGRMDHALAALSALIAYRDRPVLLLGDDDVCFCWNADLALELPVGCRVSFFPMAQVRGIASSGLDWVLEGVELQPGGLVGTSNRASGGVIRASFDRPEVIAMIPLDHLDAALGAFNIPGH